MFVSEIVFLKLHLRNSRGQKMQFPRLKTSFERRPCTRRDAAHVHRVFECKTDGLKAPQNLFGPAFRTASRLNFTHQKRSRPFQVAIFGKLGTINGISYKNIRIETLGPMHVRRVGGRPFFKLGGRNRPVRFSLRRHCGQNLFGNINAAEPLPFSGFKLIVPF